MQEWEGFLRILSGNYWDKVFIRLIFIVNMTVSSKKEYYCKNPKCQRKIGYKGNFCTNSHCEFQDIKKETPPSVDKNDKKLFSDTPFEGPTTGFYNPSSSPTLEWEERIKIIIAQSAPTDLIGLWKNGDFNFLLKNLGKLFASETQKAYKKGISDSEKAILHIHNSSWEFMEENVLSAEVAWSKLVEQAKQEGKREAINEIEICKQLVCDNCVPILNKC